MTLSRAYFAPTAFGLSLLATTAAADVTATQVWGDWRGYMEGMGYAVDATEMAEGNTLKVSDIALQINGGPDIASMTMRMGPIEFVEQGDGTVEIVMPQVMPMSVDIVPKSTEKPTHIAFEYSQIGQRMIASGDADAMQYDQSAESFGITLTELEVDGLAFDQSAARFSLTASGVQSLTKVTLNDTRKYEQEIQISNTAYSLFFQSPTGVEAMDLNSTLDNLTFAGTSSLPTDGIPQTQDLSVLLASGFAFDGAFTTDKTETKAEIVSDEGTSKIKTTAGSSTVSVAMGMDGISYDVGASDMQMGGQLAGLPFPLFVEMAKSGFELRAPLLKTDTPQDFTLAFDMTEFTMSDIIWALFDPSGQLPRDPATIALDLRGKAKVLFDSFDPEVMAANRTAPAEINALTIERLTVDAVGAKIEATGDVTFDNADKVTIPGVPKPVGDIDINVAGANALMDKLVAMGFLPSDKVMGARLMLNLFAVAGDAPDTLKSKIEFNEAGQILANGQRIK